MSKPFFTFPLCLLAAPADDFKDRLQLIVSSSIVRAGTGAEPESISDPRIIEYVAAHKVTDFDGSEGHKQVIRGAIICGVTVGSPRGTLNRANTAQKHVASHEAVHGTSPLVFVATEILWDCHNDGGLSYRDFSTLCAVNSIIAFKKTPVLIRRCMIEARQLGFKTPASLKLALASRREKIVPLTTQQLRDSLDRLESRSFFCRCQASRTCVYFSTTLDRDALREAVKTRWEKKGWLKSFRESDREVFGGTKQEPRENHLKSKPAKRSKKEPLKNEAPSSNQVGTTEGTTTGTKQEPLKEVPSNKSPLINAFKEKLNTACEGFENSKIEKLEIEVEPEPEPQKPAFEPPLIEGDKGVKEFARSLVPKRPKQCEHHGLQWFTDHGNDPRWTTEDWKIPCAKYVLRQIQKDKAKGVTA